jgi:hypothetical protein
MLALSAATTQLPISLRRWVNSWGLGRLKRVVPLGSMRLLLASRPRALESAKTTQPSHTPFAEGIALQTSDTTDYHPYQW